MIAFTETDSGIAVPTRLRTQVIPWEALNALNPPSAQPQVSTDMLSTFAVLVAKGPRAPALVGTDEHSALLVNAEINQHTTVGRAQAAGDGVLMVSDPTFGGPGDVFLVIPQTGAAAHGPYQVSGKGQDADGTIHLLFALQQNVSVGDGARRLPLIGISGALNTVQIGQPQGGTVPVQLLATSGLFTATQTLGGSTVTTGVTTLINGTANTSTRLFALWLMVSGQTAGTTIATLEDAFGNIAVGIAVGPLENDGQVTVYKNGTPIAQSQAFNVNVRSLGTGATVWFSVDYSPGLA